MRTRGILRRLIASAVLVATIAGGAVAVTESPALAAGTSCKTLYLNGDWWTAINPHMSVPICYNGSSVWQSGSITPGVTTYGYNVPGITWYGTYGGGGWLGAGENFNATAWGGWATFYCAPRWGINAWGNVISYSRDC